MNRTPERTNFQPVKNSSSADVALNTAYIQGQFQSAAQPCLSRRMPVVLGTFTSRPRLLKRPDSAIHRKKHYPAEKY